MTLAERILAQLADRPLSVEGLKKALKMKSAAVSEIRKELVLLNRAHRIRKEQYAWVRVDYGAPVEAPPAPVVKPKRRGGLTIRIISLLAEGPLSHAGMVARLDAKKTTLDNRLHQLKKAGYIERSEDGLWSLPAKSDGNALGDMARRYLSNLPRCPTCNAPIDARAGAA